MKIFAHRGASGLAPENTLAAIKLALTMPISGVEIDVYPVENDYVVLHDRWLTRTAGLAKRIDQISLSEIRTLTAGNYQGQSQPIPLLSEVLALPWGSKLLNIELKHLDNSLHFINYLDSHVNHNVNLSLKNIVISSFNHHYLTNIKKLENGLKFSWLTASNYLDYAQQAHQQRCYSINIHLDVVDQAMVHSAHALGMQIFVFTADELDDIQMLQSMGVDGVFTNRPDRVSDFIDANKQPD